MIAVNVIGKLFYHSLPLMGLFIYHNYFPLYGDKRSNETYSAVPSPVYWDLEYSKE